MLLRSYPWCALLAGVALVSLVGGCSKLTEPPKQEAMTMGENAPAEAKQPPPSQPTATPTPAPTPPKPAPPPLDPNAKLEIKDLTVGKGAEAKAGDTVKVHYVGKLASNGEEFDASRNR